MALSRAGFHAPEGTSLVGDGVNVHIFDGTGGEVQIDEKDFEAMLASLRFHLQRDRAG